MARPVLIVGPVIKNVHAHCSSLTGLTSAVKNVLQDQKLLLTVLHERVDLVRGDFELLPVEVKGPIL